jgi:hypothetical protein
MCLLYVSKAQLYPLLFLILFQLLLRLLYGLLWPFSQRTQFTSGGPPRGGGHAPWFQICYPNLPGSGHDMKGDGQIFRAFGADNGRYAAVMTAGA